MKLPYLGVLVNCIIKNLILNVKIKKKIIKSMKPIYNLAKNKIKLQSIIFKANKFFKKAK
jgi:hypothetical protein